MKEQNSMTSEIIKGIGSNMTQEDYLKLVGSGNEWELSEAQAIMKINEEFGFEASRIKIIPEIKTFYKDGNHVKTAQTIERKPQYCATDCNYIRFDVAGWYYEMVNGILQIYYC
jgi:hypothetical protein